MKSRYLIAVLGCAAALPAAEPTMAANSEHNGACVGFGGVTAGVKFAGIKCYRDIEPGNYVIRYTVKERENPAEYKALLKVPRKPVRCTLVSRGTRRTGNMDVTSYDIKNC